MAEPPNSVINQRVKCWSRLLTTAIPFQVQSIKIIKSNVFVPQIIDLNRIVAFIGLHGTGKSLLLRMIEASFGYTTPVYSPPYLTGTGTLSPEIEASLEGIVEVSLKTPQGDFSRVVDLSRSAESRAQIWIEVFGEAFAAWYADPIGAFTDLHYICDDYPIKAGEAAAESERELSRAELDALNNILGRRYDSVTVKSARIDDLDVPIISATLGARKLDNTTMSQGELWVHFINWLLEYVGDKGHLALIDEPEAFLSAQGRRPFVDFIARSALRNERQIVIGTHSLEILSRFPLANVRMCVAGNSGVQIVTPRSLTQIRDCIGAQTPIRSLALVEDELAKQLLSTIFSWYDTALTREVEIIPAGGASEVISGLRILEKTDRLACFAVLDGDQRVRHPDETSERTTSTLYFLPGDECPEVQLISSVLDQLVWTAEVLGVHSDQVFTAVSSCQHLDHQYRLGRIAEQLGYSEETLTQIFINTWLRRHDVGEQAERLVKKIRNSLARLSL